MACYLGYKKRSPEEQKAWLQRRMDNYSDLLFTMFQRMDEVDGLESWKQAKNASAVITDPGQLDNSEYTEAFSDLVESIGAGLDSDLATHFMLYRNNIVSGGNKQDFLDSNEGKGLTELEVAQFDALMEITEMPSEDIMTTDVFFQKVINESHMSSSEKMRRVDMLVNMFRLQLDRIQKEHPRWDRDKVVWYAFGNGNYRYSVFFNEIYDALVTESQLSDAELSLKIKENALDYTKPAVDSKGKEIPGAEPVPDPDTYRERINVLLDNYLDLEVTKKTNKKGKEVIDTMDVYSVGDLYPMTLRGLTRLGIKVNTYGDNVSLSPTAEQVIDDSHDTTEKIAEMEIAEEENTRESWQVESIGVSPKESLTQLLKSWLGSIQRDLSDDLGFPVFLSNTEVYNILQERVANSNSTEIMMRKLEEVRDSFKWMPKVIQDLQNSPVLATQLWVHVGQKATPTYKIVIRNKNGGWDLINASSATAVTSIFNEWEGSYHSQDNELFNKKMEIDPKVAKQKAKTLEKMLSDKDTTPEQWRDFLITVGIRVDEKALESLMQKPMKFTSFIGRTPSADRARSIYGILDYAMRGDDPFHSGTEGTTPIRGAISKLVEYYPNYYQSAHKNVNNEIVFGHIAASFMSTMISKIKQSTFEERQSFIQELREDPFLKHAPWLVELAEDRKLAEKMEFVIMEGIRDQGKAKGTEYSKMSRKELLTAMLAGYKNGSNWTKDNSQVYFLNPILADAGVTTMMGFRNYKHIESDSEQNILGMLAGQENEDGSIQYGVVQQEWTRIQDVNRKMEENREDIKAGKPTRNPNIANKYKVSKDGKVRGQLFHFFPFLDTLSERDLSNIELLKTLIKNEIEGEVVTEVDKDGNEIEVRRGGMLGNLIETMENYEMIDYPNSFYFDGSFSSYDKGLRPFLREFLYNHILAQTQIISIFPGDLAYYKNTEDFFKRVKEIWSPGTYIDTSATWRDKRTGDISSVREYYTTMYLDDVEVFSQHANAIYDALIQTGTEPNLAKKIASEYGYTDGTKVKNKDGELVSGVTLKEDGKEVKLESMKVNETDGQAYITLDRWKEIQVGQGAWSHNLEDAYKAAKEGKATPGHLRVIIQTLKPYVFTHNTHNGERIPTQHKNSEFPLIPIIAAKSSILNDLLQQMNKLGVDSIQFNSAVKVGSFGSVSPDGDRVYDLSKGHIHVMDNADYRIQMATPEHHFDAENLLGSQLRKLISADLSDQEVVDLIDTILTRDVEEDLKALGYRFGTLWDILQSLKEEVDKRELGEQYIRALEINPRTGRPNLALWNPIHSDKNESMISSIFKSAGTKRKQNGSSLYNLSGFGFSDKLGIKFNSDGSIKYVEAILPPWTRDFVRKNDVISLEELPEDLKRGIVYRIPTEYKYSMFPIKVVDWLPKESGGAILMPTEVTTIAGLDFDIDKVYAIFYNHFIERTESTETEKDFQHWANTLQWSPKLDKKINRREMFGEDFDEVKARKEFSALPEVQKKNIYFDEKDHRGTPYGTFFEPDKYKKLPSRQILEEEKAAELSKAQKELDIILKKENALVKEKKTLIPKDINRKKELQKEVKRLMTEEKEMRDNLKLDLFLDMLQRTEVAKQFLKPGGFSTYKNVIGEIRKKIESGTELNPIDPLTTLEIFERNMTGADLISIFANLNATHALFQNSGLHLNQGIAFDGRYDEATALNRTEAFDPTRTVTENIAELLAASVDNAKDPLAAFGNVNQYTANIIGLILSTGHSLETAINFVSQPAIKEFTKRYYIYGADTKAENRAKREVIELLGYGDPNKVKIPSKPYDLKTEDLKKNIGKGFENQELARKAFFSFLVYNDQAKVFNDLVRATKLADKGPGPGVADNIVAIRLWEKVKGNPDISGSEDILEMLSGTKEFLDGSNGPKHINAMYQTILKANDFFRDSAQGNFPHLTKGMEQVRELFGDFKYSFNGRDLTTDEIKRINKAFISFLSSGFGPLDYRFSSDHQNKTVSMLEKYVKDNPNSEYNPFLKALKVRWKEGISFKWIEFENAAGVDPIHGQLIKDTWEEMLTSEDQKAMELGHQLATYQYFMHGFQFTPKSFGHIIPIGFMTGFRSQNGLHFDDFLFDAKERLENGLPHGIATRFFNQYVRNFFGRESYIPSIEYVVNKKTKKVQKNVKEVKFDANEKPSQVTISSTERKATPEFTKTIRDFEGQKVTAPVDFIKMRFDDKFYLFKLAESTESGDAQYIREDILGEHNHKQEWDVNNDHPQTQIKNSTRSNYSNDPGVATLESLENRVDAGMPEDFDFSGDPQKTLDQQQVTKPDDDTSDICGISWDPVG